MLSSSRVMPCRASFNVCPAMMRAFSSSSFPSFVRWIRLVRRSFLSEIRTTRCCRSMLSMRRVMLGLSLKVALHNSCCVTPSFSHRKIRTVHCSGLISRPFWRKLRYSFRLIAAETLPFRMANISRMSKLNCSIMKLLFKQLCKVSYFRDKSYLLDTKKD
mgnify:CR=1 FL=1